MRLSIYREDTFERFVELPADGDLRLGRAPDNDIVLDDPDKGISRYHAEIRCENGACAIVDLNSQNGIWIDDQRVGNMVIGIGTAITLGPFRLLVEESDLASAADDSQYTRVIRDEAPADPYVAARRSPPTPPNLPPPPPARRQTPISRGVLAGVLIAVLLLLIGIVSVRSQLRNKRIIEPEETKPVSPPAQTTTSVPIEQPPPDLFQGHLDAARVALDGGDLDRAASEAQAALDVQPANEQALQLKREVDGRRSREGPAGIQPADDPLHDLPKDIPRGARNRRESADDYKNRMIGYYAAWNRAKDALKRGDADTALDALNGVPDDKTYPDKAVLLRTARELKAASLVNASRDQLAKARSLEATGDLLQALHVYQQLSNSTDPGIASEAKSKVAALPTAIDAAIVDAYREAHNFSLGDSAEYKQKGLEAFRRVLRLTEAGDSRRAEAEQRLRPRGGR